MKGKMHSPNCPDSDTKSCPEFNSCLHTWLSIADLFMLLLPVLFSGFTLVDVGFSFED